MLDIGSLQQSLCVCVYVGNEKGSAQHIKGKKRYECYKDGASNKQIFPKYCASKIELMQNERQFK